MATKATLADKILDTALKLTEVQSWEKLRLQAIAEELKINLDQIRVHYAQKDDLVEAWFDRADSVMLQAATAPGLSVMNMRERLHHIIMSWLDALATHHTVTRDMLLYKLEPAHIHLQVQGMLRISRTVQWIREAAQQDSAHLRRILEEIGLTSIYLATFMFWLNDRSEQQTRTRAFLDHRLRDAEYLVTKLPGFIPEMKSVSEKYPSPYARTPWNNNF